MTDPMPLILEPRDLANAPADPHRIIVDLGSEASYTAGHVPGALHLPPQALVIGRPPVPNKLPELEQLERVFGQLGHTEDAHYVVYDDEGGGWAGRFIWTLDIIGHKRYSYLNGGIHAWRGEGLTLETQANQTTPTSPPLRIHKAPRAELTEIQAHLDDDRLCIWDARSPQEYNGEKVTAQKAGHIPGAINCEWTDLMDRERHLRIRNDARSRLESLGITPDKDIITHCQGHHRSGFTYLVGKSLGLPIRGYDGSWAEWGNHPDTPVEK